MKCAIDMVGACYLGPLCKGQTTHLICLDPSSEKYRAVKMWDTPIVCVNYHWLFDCLKHWRHEDEARYSFKNMDEVSTEDEEECQNEEKEVIQSLFDLSDK